MQTLNLYGEFQKFDMDGESLLVSGVLSTPDKDKQGEIVDPEAMRKALGDFLVNGTSREMHQPIAAGKPIAGFVDEMGVTRITVKVVDKGTIAKIKEGVLKGFSIGGSALKKEGNRIVELSLKDASLVDIPANPKCVFDVVKFDKPQDHCDDPECLHHTEGHFGKCASCMAKADSEGVGGHLVDSEGKKHLPTTVHGKFDARLAGAAWAALHEGFRGHKYEGPDKQAASERLKRLYHEHGMSPPGERESEEKCMKTLMCKMLNLDESADEEAIIKSFQTKLASTGTRDVSTVAAELAKMQNSLGDIQKQFAAANERATAAERSNILQKMEREGRVAMKEDGLAYTADELQKMDMTVLKILVVNSPKVPLQSRAIFKGIGTGPMIDQKLTGDNLIEAAFSQQYPSLDEAKARYTVN